MRQTTIFDEIRKADRIIGDTAYFLDVDGYGKRDAQAEYATAANFLRPLTDPLEEKFIAEVVKSVTEPASV